MKGFTLLIIFLVILNINANAEKPVNNSFNNLSKEIRIALFTMGDLYGSTIQIYLDIFDEYQWVVDNVTYYFSINKIEDKDIQKGELTLKNYDVLLIPYMEASYLIFKHFFPSFKNFIWKKMFSNFIKEGGGYVGYCASANLITKLNNQPDTINEFIYKKMHIDITEVQSKDELGFPFLIQFSGYPEKIGSQAYVWFSGWNESNLSHWFGGCCLDVVVEKDNPIFNDLYENSRRIFWCAGSPLLVPNSSSNVKSIAYFPEEEISSNKSTQVHAWKYTGRFFGLLKGFIKSFKTKESISDLFYFTPFKAIDWEMTDKIIETNVANETFMTMEEYPNENNGRLILCSGHPEDRVWWGGYIKEKKDTDHNCLYDSLHYWTNITPTYKTLANEETYNWWLVRRHAAWVSKVPNKDLPPIYGPSQIKDIFPYIKKSPFKIFGCVESTPGIISVDLYYRYSKNNNTWDNWTYYNTDYNQLDGWSWDFNAPKGIGYYEFYSLRKVEYENFIEMEKSPPGPDTITRIIE
jgi:hypothetical protein